MVGSSRDTSISEVLLGFFGCGSLRAAHAAWGHPPTLAYQCPGLFLLHDVIHTPPHVFDLEYEESLDTPEYLLLADLLDAGILQVAPRQDYDPGGSLSELVCRQAANDVRIALALKEKSLLSTAGRWTNELGESRNTDGGGGIWRQSVQKCTQSHLSVALDQNYLMVESARLGVACAWELMQDLLHHFKYLAAGYTTTQFAEQASRGIFEIRIPIPAGPILLTAQGEPAHVCDEEIMAMARYGELSVGEGTFERPFRWADWSRTRERLRQVQAIRNDPYFGWVRRNLAVWRSQVANAESADEAREVTNDAAARMGELRPGAGLAREFDQLGGTTEMIATAISLPVDPEEFAGVRNSRAFPLLHESEVYGPSGIWIPPPVSAKR
jgi:hypothetical protein